jgi:tetratricopeptide (TPR) repeat protein
MPTGLRGAGLAILAVACLPIAAPAQIPDEFRNLKFFPEDISKEDLVQSMREFSFALGVRCTYCHVAKEDDPHSVGDFSSDDKIEKRKARAMMEMVRAINAKYLPELPEREDPSVDVSCATCHGGITTPRRLEDHLENVRAKDGMDAALESYRSLREQYYGTDAYDFGPRSLTSFGEQLERAGRSTEALTVFELSREFFPESVEVLLNLAKAYEGAGRNEEAVATYRKLLELSPDGSWAARMARQSIDRLGEP